MNVTLFAICTLLWSCLGVVWVSRAPIPIDARDRIAGLIFAGPIVWFVSLVLLASGLAEDDEL